LVLAEDLAFDKKGNPVFVTIRRAKLKLLIEANEIVPVPLV